MSIVVGENSWVTIAEADDYLTYVVGSSAWFALSETPASPGDASKESYLRMAFDILVNKAEYCLTAGLTDDNVDKAQIEMALYLVNGQSNFEQDSDMMAKGVKSFTLSKWREDYGDNNWYASFPLPSSVSKFLGAYLAYGMLIDVKVE